MPSWGAPQDQPVQNALQNGRKRKAIDLDNHAFAYDRDDMNVYPDNLRPQRPPGRTLGGDRIPTMPAYNGELVELRPAYLPKTNVSVPQEAMELAVPAVKAHMLLKWDQEDNEAETLEYRNYADPASECIKPRRGPLYPDWSDVLRYHLGRIVRGGAGELQGPTPMGRLSTDCYRPGHLLAHLLCRVLREQEPERLLAVGKKVGPLSPQCPP